MWPEDFLLSIKNVTKIYPTGTQALRGICLDSKKGEVLGLLGPNGAGKTTLSSIVASLHPVTSGEILIESGSIYQDLINYRYMIGLCPQKPNIDLMLTMEENLIFAGRYFNLPELKIKERITYLSDRFQLTQYLKS